MTRLLSRREWGARAPKRENPHPITSMGEPVDLIVLHHTVTPESPFESLLRSMQDDHLDNQGWFDIAYNFAASNRTDQVAVLRGPGLQAGATGAKVDATCLTIAAVGHFHNKRGSGEPALAIPTDRLVENIAWLCRLLIEQGYLAWSFEMKPHSQFAPTACCGSNLAARIPEIMERVAVRVPPKGMTDGQKLAAIQKILDT